jgi:RecA/RadA recombinase
MSNDFFKDVTRVVGKINPDINEFGDVEEWVDTGSYLLNALLSGSVYGGIPNNKIVALAGESSTGKTFFTLGIVGQFLQDNPEGGVFYFESEDAITKQMLDERGIDSDRVISVPVTTVQQFRHQAITILDKYLEVPKKDRQPMMFCLDSLGMLSTTKEIEDTAEGKETKDMTRAGLIRAAFRVLTLKLGRAGVPMVVTNHTYETMGMFSTKEMSGGAGLKYASDYIVFLSKKKEKDGTEVVGNIIHCLNKKSRLTKENMMVDVLLRYDSGLSRYYGLADLAVEAGVWKKLSTKYETPEGSFFGKAIMKDPERFFTKEVLDAIDGVCREKFCYGSAITEEVAEDE